MPSKRVLKGVGIGAGYFAPFHHEAWARRPEVRITAVYETGIHFIDTFRFLMGEVVSVYARMRRLNPVIGGEDAGQLFLTFANGSTAIRDANRYNETDLAPGKRRMTSRRVEVS